MPRVTLLTVGLLGAALTIGMGGAHSESPAELKKFFPIALKCPAENSGILELASANKRQEQDRLRVTYYDSVGTIVLYSVAPVGMDLIDVRQIDVRTEPDPAVKKVAEKLVEHADRLLRDVCLA